MRPSHTFSITTLTLATLTLFASATLADAPPAKSLLPTAPDDATVKVLPSSNLVTIDQANGLLVTAQPGNESYPGIDLHPASGVWDLSPFGHVDARVVNTGKTPIGVTLRVDNGNDWN